MKRVLNVSNLETHLAKSINEDIFSITHELVRIRVKLSSNERFFVFRTKSLYTKNLISLIGNMTRYNVKYT